MYSDLFRNCSKGDNTLQNREVSTGYRNVFEELNVIAYVNDINDYAHNMDFLNGKLIIICSFETDIFEEKLNNLRLEYEKDYIRGIDLTEPTTAWKAVVGSVLHLPD